MASPPIVLKLLKYMTLGDRELALLEQFGQGQRSVAAGTQLLDPREMYSTAFLINSGWALRYRAFPDGRRQIINFLLPGDAFGLGAIVLSRPDHNISAITPVSVSPIAPEALLGMMREHPRLGAAFLWSAAQEEAVLREHIVNIGRRSALQRTAQLLVELLVRLAGVGRARHGRYAFPLTQAMLADALGLSTVHMNRTMRRLHHERLIHVSARHIEIVDVHALCGVAQFSPGFLHLGSRRAEDLLATQA